ncbi:MAG: phosphomethylpyrimidine synthase ThiC [Endomicrobiaceae bacterium]|nr:phosphomethylpyrimidine synthase ThiC [Endomicrobiaceae bacterium]
MGLMDEAKKNIITKEIQEVANYEQISTAIIINGINDGSIVIPKNIKRNLQRTVAVGKGLKTKVNANLGTSPDHISIEEELEKMDIAVKAGADAIMDLSTGGNLIEIRKEILARCPVCVGTVPIYQVACQTVKQKKKISQMDPELMFDVIEEQAEEGVDFMTIHCGINRETVEILKRQPRHTGVVSRGGSFLVKWINANNKENPYYEQYDRLLKIAKKYDITLSLGDGFRPGCTFDASDGPQLAELSVLGELVSRARAVGVQTMIEGPGHMPLDQIQANVLLAKRLGHNAPLYFLGPLVTDIAPGYDHITSAIGGAMAASYGVDFICYVTPAEHLKLPNAQDVHDGVIAARIAAHSADIVKNVKGARQQDFEISKWRKERNWDKQKEFSIDPVKFEKERAKLLSKQSDVCTMCGEFCSMKEEL